MRHAPAMLYAAGGLGLAIAGWMLVSFWCPYGVVSSMMTGRIPVPGIGVWVPYPWVLMSSVYLVLYAVYLWAGLDLAKIPLRQPLLFVLLGVGVAAFGFLDLYYPCPVRIDLALLLDLEAPIAGIAIAYKWILALADVLLAYAGIVNVRSPSQ